MELKNIRIERVKHDYTQKQIAAYLGVTVQTMRHYEIDPGKMPASKYFKLIGLFDEFKLKPGQEQYITQQVNDRLPDVIERPDEPKEIEVEIGVISLKTRDVRVFLFFDYDHENYNFQQFEDTGLEYNTKYFASNVEILVQVIDPVHDDVNEEIFLPQYCCDSIEIKLNNILN